MVFVDTTPDYEALVFLIMLSKRGDRLTIIDGPPELTQQLGIELRRNFPRRITTDRATEDGLHIFEVKKGSYGSKYTSISASAPSIAVARLTTPSSLPRHTPVC